MSGSSSAAIARSEVQLGVKECDGRDGQPAGEIAAGRGGTAETRGGRNKQPEGETGRRAIGGELLNASLHRPSADDVTRPPLFSINFTLFSSRVPT